MERQKSELIQFALPKHPLLIEAALLSVERMSAINPQDEQSKQQERLYLAMCVSRMTEEQQIEFVNAVEENREKVNKLIQETNESVRKPTL